MFKDLTGQTFGYLTVIERVENDKHGNARWLCRCDCGNEVVVCGKNLRTGLTKFCDTYNVTDESMLITWKDIKVRCYKENALNFDRYGGRGIKMFPAWINDYKAFYDYVSQLENFGRAGYTLDRIDNNGNYEPENLRFATAKEQSRNKRNNIWVEYEGEKLCLKDAAKKAGIDYNTLFRRYRAGDRGERLFRPTQKEYRSKKYQSQE